MELVTSRPEPTRPGPSARRPQRRLLELVRDDGELEAREVVHDYEATEADGSSEVSLGIAELWDRINFRFHDAYGSEMDPAWRMELASQPRGELWLVLRGTCWSSLGDEQVVAAPGQILLFRPGQPRASANLGGEPLSLIGFDFDVLLFRAIDVLGRIELPLLIAEPSPRLVRLVRRTYEATGGDMTDRVFRTGALGELAFAEVLRCAFRDRPCGSLARETLVREEVRHALAFIAGCYERPLDPQAIADAVFLSPKHLTRCFREALGITPMAYLRRYRLERARDLLLGSDLPITQVAHQTGFREHAHFSRAFKAQYGDSPRDHREHARALQSNG